MNVKLFQSAPTEGAAPLVRKFGQAIRCGFTKKSRNFIIDMVYQTMFSAFELAFAPFEPLPPSKEEQEKDKELWRIRERVVKDTVRECGYLCLESDYYLGCTRFYLDPIPGKFIQMNQWDGVRPVFTHPRPEKYDHIAKLNGLQGPSKHHASGVSVDL
jgi:hypothetical protein